MGNRTFLYTTDTLPNPADQDAGRPTLLAEVASGNNWLPPLWLVLLSPSVAGPAQDAQQVFLPSVCGGIYAPRALAEERMFALLDFLTTHPLLADPDDFAEQVEQLRTQLAEVEGAAYCADLNEWYALSDGGLSPDAWLDGFAQDCANRWEQAQAAMAEGDHAAINTLYEFDPTDAADSLGFQCWNLDDDSDASDDVDTYLGEGLERFEQDGKIGLRQVDGLATVLAPVLDDVWEFCEGFAIGQVDGQFGYLDATGQWLAPPSFDGAWDFCCGMAMVERGGLLGYIDSTGALAVPPRFLGESEAFNAHGTACVQAAGGFGVIDRRGEFVIAPTHASVVWHEELKAWECRAGEDGCDVFHASGTPWFSGPFGGIHSPGENGDAVVTRAGRYGTIQPNGQPGIALEYDDIELLTLEAPDETGASRSVYTVSASNGQGQVTGACRGDGALLVPLQFDLVGPLAQMGDQGSLRPLPAYIVSTEDAEGVGVWSLEANGLILPCEFDLVQGFFVAETPYFLVQAMSGGWSIADQRGRFVNEQPFDWIAQAMPDDPDEWIVILATRDIDKAWSAGEAAVCGRDGACWLLHQDGRCEAELTYLMRRVHAAAPIVAARSVFSRVFNRGDANVIEGVGDPDACLRLGEIYANGEGVEIDEVQASRWFATAAAGGNSTAQLLYASRLVYGPGCEPDEHAARQWLEPLADEDNRAANLLAVVLAWRLGKDCDPARARALFMRVAGSDQYGLQSAQYYAGYCWRHGVGGPADQEQALKYFELATTKTPYRDGPHLDACQEAAEIYCEQAAAAQAAGRRKEHTRALKRATHFLRQLQNDEDYFDAARELRERYGLGKS
ncbi:MAG: SEL1-like repeat protein [Gammaproteobacteria bacterium]